MRPAVSIRMITFNHEKFIARSIESVLMQRIDFETELIIGVDHGNDSTADIVRDFESRFPGRIKAVIRQKNIGMVPNSLDTLRRCTGRYIAKIDGDDWWTDPYKLQMQFDILEANPEYAICFHNLEVRYTDPVQPSGLMCPRNQPLLSDRMDLAFGNFIPSSSVFFRSGGVKPLPEWFRTLPFTDWALNILAAQQGKIFYLPKILGVYNAHDGGIWSSMTERAKLHKTLLAQRIITNHYKDDQAFADLLVQGKRRMIGKFLAKEKEQNPKSDPSD